MGRVQARAARSLIRTLPWVWRKSEKLGWGVIRLSSLAMSRRGAASNMLSLGNGCPTLGEVASERRHSRAA